MFLLADFILRMASKVKAEYTDFMTQKISYLPSTLSELRNVDVSGYTCCY